MAMCKAFIKLVFYKTHSDFELISIPISEFYYSPALSSFFLCSFSFCPPLTQITQTLWPFQFYIFPTNMKLILIIISTLWKFLYMNRGLLWLLTPCLFSSSPNGDNYQNLPSHSLDLDLVYSKLKLDHL